MGISVGGNDDCEWDAYVYGYGFVDTEEFEGYCILEVMFWVRG